MVGVQVELEGGHQYPPRSPLVLREWDNCSHVLWEQEDFAPVSWES